MGCKSDAHRVRQAARGEAVGKPSVAGVYTNQRLNLSKPWEGTRRTCQGLEPDPGNLAVRDFRGASRNVRHGETVNPPCDRKSRTGNPSPTAGRARSLSQPWAMEKAKRARKAETPKQPSLRLRLRAPYLYPDRAYSASSTVVFIAVTAAAPLIASVTHCRPAHPSRARSGRPPG